MMNPPTPVDGTLRKFALRIPAVISQCSGITIFGKLYRSIVFSTDLAIIRNVNADAIMAVYPFTPQPVITQAIVSASDIPVFAGVGGGLTQGKRVIHMALHFSTIPLANTLEIFSGAVHSHVLPIVTNLAPGGM